MGFSDSFFDLKMEVNFCLKEVLELEEKTDDLELEDIVKVWAGGTVVVRFFGGLEESENGGGSEHWAFYIRTAQPKPKVWGAVPYGAPCIGRTHTLPAFCVKVTGYLQRTVTRKICAPRPPGMAKREAFLIDSRSWESGKRGRVTRI